MGCCYANPRKKEERGPEPNENKLTPQEYGCIYVEPNREGKG